MKYEDIRSQIKSGDILAFSHEGLKSWGDFESQLVRMGTRSHYTHVGIAWVSNSRVFIIEAVVPEVRIFPLSNYKNFDLIPMSGFNKEEEEFLFSKIGEKYSKWEAIKAMWSSPDNSNSKWQCAELTKAALEKSGVILKGKTRPYDIVKELLLDYNTHLISVEV